jgi:anaerobic selenocysteine-containing dehydrogenase
MRRCDDGSYETIDWDTAFSEIAKKMAAVRDTYGGERIFYYGGGGQGNHLGGAYAPSVRSALGMKYKGNGASQEKTGWSWVLGRTLGNMPNINVEEAQVAMFVGKNPFMTNGIDQARTFLRHIKKDSKRTLIVMDPRRTETTDYADIHLAVKPGRDVWCLAALIGCIVQNDLLPHDWLAAHTAGADKVVEYFKDIPIDEYAAFAGLEPELVRKTARIIAEAESFALEEDLGVQMSPHSTLASYLNVLFYILTGNYGKPGTVFPSKQLADILPLDKYPVDENGFESGRKRLPVTGARIVSGLYCGNYLAEEILNDDDRRARALIVEGSNPVHSLAGAEKLREAFRSLECSVAIDIAMTETARECDYVLPAPTTYEKWEATFFPNNFPENIFHLRRPLMEAAPGTISEPEIHSRLVGALEVFEDGELDVLHEAASKGFATYRGEFFRQVKINRKIGKMIPYVLYRTLGPTLPEGQQATAAIWGLCQVFAMKNPKEVVNAGCTGSDPGTELYQKIIDSPSGTVISVSSPEDAFAEIPFPDNKIQLVIGELLEELGELKKLQPLVDTSEEFPFSLVAGSRRAYTGNCLIRDPRWVKGKNGQALTMHPDDGEKQNLPEGAWVVLESATGRAKAQLAYDERNRPGTVTIPNGQGMLFHDENGERLETGVYANELTTETHRDKFIGTPFHKFVPVKVSLAE